MVTLSSISYRSPRRARLSFSGTLAINAFCPEFWGIYSDDELGNDSSVFSSACDTAAGGSITVVAVYLVTGTTVELAFSSDLVSGTSYTITYTALPVADETTITGSGQLVTPGAVLQPSTTVPVDEFDKLLYGVDLIWNPAIGDLMESPTGDLATVTGVSNANAALARCALSDGLPWAPSYGAHPSEYIDAPVGSLPAFRGQLERALRKDDRVISIKTTIDPSRNDGQETVRCQIQLEGGQTTQIGASP